MKYINIKRSVIILYVISSDLFYRCIEIFLRELDDLPGFIIGACNINNIYYDEETTLSVEWIIWNFPIASSLDGKSLNLCPGNKELIYITSNEYTNTLGLIFSMISPII